MDEKLIEALGKLQDLLQEYYKDNEIRIAYDLNDLVAFVIPENSWGMTVLFSDEHLDCKVEDALDRLDFKLQWETEYKFWLSPVGL